MRANQRKYCSLRLEILSVSCGGHFVTAPAQRYCECVCVFCLLYNAPAVKLLASGPFKHKEPVGGLLLFAFTHTHPRSLSIWLLMGSRVLLPFVRGCVEAFL